MSRRRSPRTDCSQELGSQPCAAALRSGLRVPARLTGVRSPQARRAHAANEFERAVTQRRHIGRLARRRMAHGRVCPTQQFPDMLEGLTNASGTVARPKAVELGAQSLSGPVQPEAHPCQEPRYYAPPRDGIPGGSEGSVSHGHRWLISIVRLTVPNDATTLTAFGCVRRSGDATADLPCFQDEL